jgi:hypothetical protein
MEARQHKNFNATRDQHIRRFKGLLAGAVVREQTRSGRNQAVFGSKLGAGVNLQGINQNKREDKFANEAVRRGWTVIKRGWPDFLCWQGEEVMFVEVKPEGDGLSCSGSAGNGDSVPQLR